MEREREGGRERRRVRRREERYERARKFLVYRWMDFIPRRRREQRGIEAEKRGDPTCVVLI